MRKIATLTIVGIICLFTVVTYSESVKAATNDLEMPSGISLYKDTSQGIKNIKGVYNIKNDNTLDAGENTNPEEIYWRELVEKISGDMVLLASYLSDLGKLNPRSIEDAATMFAENDKYKQQALAELYSCRPSIDSNWQEVRKKLSPRSDDFASKEEKEAFQNELREQARKEGVSSNFKGEWR